MIKLSKKRKSVVNFPKGEILGRDKIYELKVDVLIPAAISYVINEGNVDRVKAKLIVEAANSQIKENLEKTLRKRGILVLPDFLVNAGGVISSFAEWRGYNPKQMSETVRRKIIKNTKLVLRESKKKNLLPRKVALEISKERVLKAMSKR